MNLVLGLVWRNPDGSHTEEAWQYLGTATVDDAVAGACIDRVAAEFGRVFVDVGSVIAVDDHDGCNTRARLGPATVALRRSLRGIGGGH